MNNRLLAKVQKYLSDTLEVSDKWSFKDFLKKSNDFFVRWQWSQTLTIVQKRVVRLSRSATIANVKVVRLSRSSTIANVQIANVQIIFLGYLLFFLFLFCTFPCLAQKSKKTLQPAPTTQAAKKQTKKAEIVAIPLVDYNQNKIQFVGQLAHFKQVIKALQKKKRRTVTILHLGDSHIQSDFFSGKLRSELQHHYGNAGRGLVFPYKEAGSSQPENYFFSATGGWEGKSSVKRNLFSRWGISGYTLRTTNSQATLQFKVLPRHPLQITQLKLLFPTQDSTQFEVKLQANQKTIKPKKKEKTYLIYQFKKPQQEFAFSFAQKKDQQTNFVLQGLIIENNQQGIVYHSAGVNGATIETFLRCADFQQQVADLQPDLIIISLGTNDALVPNFQPDLFKVNCKLLIQQLRIAAPAASLLFTSPSVSWNLDKKPNKNLTILAETLQAVAANSKASFWDFYGLSGKTANAAQWQAAYLLKNDYIHLTSKGYKLQADLLYAALQKVIEK